MKQKHKGLPGGDRILFLHVDAGLSDHRDAFNIFFINAEVGAANGDGDASLHGAVKGDNLDEEIQSVGERVGVYRWKGFEMDLNRLVVQ